MKQVDLNEAESKEFVALLEKDADSEEIAKWLDSKEPTTVSDELVPVLEIFEQLQKLQDDEISILAKCFKIRQILTENLIELLLEGPKDVKVDDSTSVPETDASDASDADAPVADQTSPQAEETSPTSTDQETPN